MIRKGTNVVQIYDDLYGTGQIDRKIWEGNLNTKQTHEILTWAIEWEFNVTISPCGGEWQDINLTKVKIKCLQGSLEFYKMESSTLTEAGEKMTFKELIKLKEQWTKKEADQKESTKQ